ncbi:hypothetical protein BO86DRAFT_228083 [Aspergillus japonicus CBS 114.51]|uniref:Uncharacterized protein n=1 Tax=Aspergillus japonicus CBS 114.51 TaxID=1448312 RepID=A0A8T8X9F4_ASPJA|nr:hypothetical protein BO86DRAFT_228083 [Aspergillus japonicus CBS 114.51]RAH84630.1 hypothetical protein BO86DRAFT_228083 [Aspergillus japonicus CBS 114.51]
MSPTSDPHLHETTPLLQDTPEDPIQAQDTALTALVEPRSPSTVYTLIGVVSSVGMLIAGPLLAGMFHLGMVLGDVWVGLLFLVAAGFYALALAGISAVRVGAVGRQ